MCLLLTKLGFCVFYYNLCVWKKSLLRVIFFTKPLCAKARCGLTILVSVGCLNIFTDNSQLLSPHFNVCNFVTLHSREVTKQVLFLVLHSLHVCVCVCVHVCMCLIAGAHAITEKLPYWREIDVTRLDGAVRSDEILMTFAVEFWFWELLWYF